MAESNYDELIGDFFEDPLTSELVQRILSMVSGSQLPSERELAEDFNVSRTALRDRLRHMEAIGVLERRTGSGTFVRQVSPETVSQSLALGLMASDITMTSLRSVRVALERQAAMEAAHARDHVSIAEMHVAVERMEASDDPDEIYAADIDFHKALFKASRSPALKFLVDSLSLLLKRFFVRIDTDNERARVRLAHRKVFEAVSSGDPVAAMDAINTHFRVIDHPESRPLRPSRKSK